MSATRLYQFFIKRRLLLFVLVVITTAILVFFSTRVTLQEDITRFIPNDEKTREVNSTLNSLKIKDKVIINIFEDKPESYGTDRMMACADLLADSLLRT